MNEWEWGVVKTLHSSGCNIVREKPHVTMYEAHMQSELISVICGMGGIYARFATNRQNQPRSHQICYIRHHAGNLALEETTCRTLVQQINNLPHDNPSRAQLQELLVDITECVQNYCPEVDTQFLMRGQHEELDIHSFLRIELKTGSLLHSKNRQSALDGASRWWNDIGHLTNPSNSVRPPVENPESPRADACLWVSCVGLYRALAGEQIKTSDNHHNPLVGDCGMFLPNWRQVINARGRTVERDGVCPITGTALRARAKAVRPRGMHFPQYYLREDGVNTGPIENEWLIVTLVGRPPGD